MGDFDKNYTKVEKEEFDKFINNYKFKLTEHSVNFCTPPSIWFCDFNQESEFFRCLIAEIVLNENLKGYEFYDKNPRPNEYFIIRDLYKKDYAVTF